MSTDRKGWREILGSRAKFVAAGIASTLRGLTQAESRPQKFRQWDK